MLLDQRLSREETCREGEQAMETNLQRGLKQMDFLSSTSILQLSQSSSIDEVPAQSTTEPQSLENIERPSLSYKDLIIEAIESSPDKRLKLNEIYQPMAKFAPLSLLALYKEHLCSAHIGNTGDGLEVCQAEQIPDAINRRRMRQHKIFVEMTRLREREHKIGGHFWTVVPELSDKQTLRRRNRSTNRGGNRLKTTESLQDTTVMREELTSSGSGDTSPSPLQPSISPSLDLPKPTASYGGIEGILGNGYKAYGQSLLSAYLYQH
ncbi:hypothetical protein OSTOST_20138, partial [Ostertagia ostertagi]